MLNWFTVTAAPRHPVRETVKVQFGDPAQPGQARAEVKVRFNEDGTPMYEPETSVLKLDYLNENGEWQTVPEDDKAHFLADKVFMDRVYAAAVKPAEQMSEDEYAPTDKEHLDSFENSTVEQIADSEKVFHMWWQSMTAEDKVEFFEGSYAMDDLADTMASNLKGMTVRDVKEKDDSIYSILLQMYESKHKKNKENAETQEQRKKDREQKIQEQQQEPAPAQETVAE